MEIEVNMLGIAIAVGVNFILGWLWYGPLFGKAWAVEMRMDMTKKPEASVMIRGMVMMIVGNFLMAYVMAHDIFAWSNVPGMESMSGLGAISSTAFFIWLGYYVPTHIGATTWENKSWKLTGINLSYHLVTLFVAAYAITNF